LKKEFTPKKGKVYLLSKEEREEMQAFVEDQLKKKYIQSSKSPKLLQYILWQKRMEHEGWCKIIDT